MALTREEAENATILRCLVGSTAHGVAVDDGLEDRDEMGIILEPMPVAWSTQTEFEQYIYRSAAEREGKHDAKSYAGDLDLVLYSARKWLRLALKGNPTILMCLFAPPLVATSRGHQLRELAPAIISRKAAGPFLGYLTAQRQRLLGERGGKDVNRPELVAKYGFDTKYAMHMLRLGMQGVELMNTGSLQLPMADEERQYLIGVRTGKYSLQEVLTRTGEVEQELKDLYTTSPLRPTPDYKRVDAWMRDAYLETWKSERTLF